MPAVRLEVYVQPRAAKTELGGMHDGVLKVRLAAPPVENAANRALVEFMAQRLGIARRAVRVVHGGTHRRKVLEIEGVTAAQIAARLAAGA